MRTRESVQPLDEYQRELNRARFLEETSQGVLELLRKSGKNRAWLSRRLGCSPAHVTKVLEGSHNFTLELLADITLALNRAVHVSWGVNVDEMRVPKDEAGTVRFVGLAPALSQTPRAWVDSSQWVPTLSRADSTEGALQRAQSVAA